MRAYLTSQTDIRHWGHLQAITAIVGPQHTQPQCRRFFSSGNSSRLFHLLLIAYCKGIIAPVVIHLDGRFRHVPIVARRSR